MSTSAIVFDQVSKRFERGERHDSLRDLIPSTLRRLTGRGAPKQDQSFWAVRDVSFEVNKGEALGIIGPNGAGKSTTLKLLTRILRPTAGACAVRGRVGALIEVASGFHPDLTGRENIFLQGAIMGMRRAEVERKLEAIVEFAGIGAFIDTPVKRYSSGMNARLGFSIAAHLEPDVLIIDEVLSVGDMSFQAKCLERMKEHVASGVTLAFVSHNLQAVSTLCKRAVVLAGGKVAFDGPTEKALGVYMSESRARNPVATDGNATFRLREASLTFAGAPGTQGVAPHSMATLEIELECLADVTDFNFGVELIRSRDLLYCYGVTTQELGVPLFSTEKGAVVRLTMSFAAHLTRGHYYLNLNARQPSSVSHIFEAPYVAQFSIHENVTYDGVVDLAASMGMAVQ